MSEYPEIAARFAKDTAGHQMTVLHDDGLYRHLRFMKPQARQHLPLRPDHLAGLPAPSAGTSAAAATPSPASRTCSSSSGVNDGINPDYWSEKLAGDRRRVETGRTRRQLVRAVRSSERRCSECRSQRRRTREGIGRPRSPADILDCDLHRRGTGRARSWSTSATKNWQLRRHVGVERSRDWDWSFLWACHAIVWGIAQYDAREGYPEGGGVVSVPLSDWLLTQAREVLAADEGTQVTDELAVVRSYCSMQRLLQAIVDSADLERAA
jgi:hypothetical protein